jgi:outer membrane immunogenic protein
MDCFGTRRSEKAQKMIRKLLLSAAGAAAIAGSIQAADLPMREAPPPYQPPPLFSWTGFYLGAQIGYAWGTDSFTATAPIFGSFANDSSTPNGVVGGAHVGYNYQIGQIVAGIEGDVDGTGYSGTRNAGFATVSTTIPVQGSLRARLGVALDRALLYVTGGAAFAAIDTEYGTFVGLDTFNRTRTGWTIGGGIEYALLTNWSLRAEYRYADYGSLRDFPIASLAPLFGLGTFVQHHETQHAIRAGVTYRFGAPAATGIAPYY